MPRPEIPLHEDSIALNIIEFVDAYGTEHGYGPSVRDVMLAVGLASTAATQQKIQKLQRHGKLTREPGLPRTLRVAQRG